MQKYIEQPLLLYGRKFDIRMWVLVSECNVYMCKNGYVRMASEQFVLDHIQNLFIHLTNNAVQKFARNYCSYEDGNQLSFGQLQQAIEDMGHDFLQLVENMKKYICISLNSVANRLDPNKRRNCFEIYGYDFFIDQDFHLWLIEVNTNPCLETSSELLEKLIPRMLDDAFKLTLDRYFNIPEDLSKKCEFQVEGIKDDENVWILLMNLQKGY